MVRIASLLLCTAWLALPASGQPAKLKDNDQYLAGLRAMQDQLPDLAIQRFEQARVAFPEDQGAARILERKIGEASVRAARMETNRPAAIARAKAALEKLSTSALKDDEEALFWSAQASLLLGHFQEAAEFFSRLGEAKDPALRRRSQLARAHLLAALDQTEEATTLLNELAEAKEEPWSTEARLLHASLLLARGDWEAAASLLPEEPKANEANPADFRRSQHQRYLRARLALARGEHAKAVTLYRELTKASGQLEASLHHGVVVGLADALHAGGENVEATETLISLIERNARSPLLESAMARLLTWTQADEPSKTRLEERLCEWAKAPTLASFEETSGEDHPKEPEHPTTVIPPDAGERAGYALYYYSRYLAEKNTAKSNKLAEILLRRLRTEFPDHPLAPASLLETARLQSAEDRNEDAIATLSPLEKSSPSPSLRIAAAKLMARLQFKEGDFNEAAEAFIRVRDSLLPGDGALANENAGISLLRAGDQAAFGGLFKSLEPSESRIALQLEQALNQAAGQQGDARPALDRFLAENPTHPRTAEARLAFAEELLRLEPKKNSAQSDARAILDSIDSTQLSYAIALRHLLMRFKLASLTDDWPPAIMEAKRLIETYENRDFDPAIRLKLAEAYYMSGQHSRAQLEFTKIAEEQKEGFLHDVALFFAARAALKFRSEKSPEEAAKLLQDVIAGEGELADASRLLLARNQIDRPSPADALTTLQPLLAEDADETYQIDALILAAEAHRALGRAVNEPANIREAIKIYDRVLARPDLPYALNNRFHSLKGQAYEDLKEPGYALDTYYRVINRENLAPGQEPSEWYWYTECGYKMVRLLEQGARYRSALEILDRIAHSGSPLAKEAADRAKDLQLEHQIWED